MTGRDVIYIILGVLILIGIIWTVNSQLKHNRMVKKMKRCTSDTNGIVESIDGEWHRHDDHDYYVEYVNIRYLGDHICRETRGNREVGDTVTIYYDPDEPGYSVSEDARDNALSQNSFVGFYRYLVGMAIFLGVGAFMFFVLMGYSVEDLKEIYNYILNYTGE